MSIPAHLVFLAGNHTKAEIQLILE